ncbi:hypothetical protein IVB33_11490 [Bradyrhizobium sp. 24]|nr:hypothetical protein [Bradyrhizobium sp. 24]
MDEGMLGYGKVALAEMMRISILSNARTDCNWMRQPGRHIMAVPVARNPSLAPPARHGYRGVACSEWSKRHTCLIFEAAVFACPKHQQRCDATQIGEFAE